jgi:hypothetical protein
MYCTPAANKIEDTRTVIMEASEVSDWELIYRLLRWTGVPAVEIHFEVMVRLAIYTGAVYVY